MDVKERVEKDIRLFNENIKEIDIEKEKPKIRKVVSLAASYCKDADFYLKKGDYVTAFACISYAHGLLDAARKIR